MNHLVFLDARAGELEKILSGVKTMLAREFDPTSTAQRPIYPGDRLYFLRDQSDCSLRVKATVLRIQCITSKEILSQTLKAMQPRLQLTEDQYNRWSAREWALLVEFGSAQKIPVVSVAPERITDRSGWIAFEDFSLIV